MNKRSRGLSYAITLVVLAVGACASAASSTPTGGVTQTGDATVTRPEPTSPVPPSQPAPASAPVPDPIRSIPRAAHPGFDTRYFPGESALRAWHEHSPYEWVGYYLVAPCQTGVTWVGKRSTIQGIGFGTAVIFVGEQDWTGPPSDSGAAAKSGGTQCTVTNLTTEKGAIDAARADSTAAAEGFTGGTVVYLDIEYVATLSTRFTTYIRSWVHSMLASGRYTPGVYVHTRNAEGVRAIIAAEYSAAGITGSPPIWVAAPTGTTTTTFDLAASTPSTSGFAYATIWQGVFNATESWGGVTLKIDANVAISPDPSDRGR